MPDIPMTSGIVKLAQGDIAPEVECDAHVGKNVS